MPETFVYIQKVVNIAMIELQEEITQQIIMDRKRKAFDEAMDNVMAEAAISGLDQFAMFCLKEIYTQANSQMQ